MSEQEDKQAFDAVWEEHAKTKIILDGDKALCDKFWNAALTHRKKLIQDYEEVLADKRRLVRELDVLINGEEDAVKQASLCDIVAQVRREGLKVPQPADADESMWCRYIASMIGEYLGEPLGSEKEKAIAGIIERRLWNLPRPTQPVDITHMVNRFLGWKLPMDFAPDCGISIDTEIAGRNGWPSGTNLFNAEQAKQMFEYVTHAQPVQPDFSDAYQGARQDAEIWKKRALEAEELNRKFIAQINDETFMGEPAQPVQPAATSAMTADRAKFFLRRFKGDEKMLGPNEQAALDFAIEKLSGPVQPVEPMIGEDFALPKPSFVPIMPPIRLPETSKPNPMSGPDLFIYEFDHPVFGTHRSLSCHSWNGMIPSRSVPFWRERLYTEAPPADAVRELVEYAEAAIHFIKSLPVETKPYEKGQVLQSDLGQAGRVIGNLEAALAKAKEHGL